MNTLSDLWCAASPRIRLACWLGWLLALWLLSCLALAGQANDEQLTRLSAENQQLWRSLHILSGGENAPDTVVNEQLLPFSPLDFQRSGVRLVYWHPSAKGGEMALKATWQALPPVFAQLAQRNMRISQFSMSKEGTALLLTLNLEALHDG